MTDYYSHTLRVFCGITTVKSKLYIFDSSIPQNNHILYLVICYSNTFEVLCRIISKQIHFLYLTGIQKLVSMHLTYNPLSKHIARLLQLTCKMLIILYLTQHLSKTICLLSLTNVCQRIFGYLTEILLLYCVLLYLTHTPSQHFSPDLLCGILQLLSGC